MLCPIFRTKGQRSRSHRLFQVLVLSACGFVPIFLNYFICGIHTTHGGRCVAHHFQDQRSRSHRSFEVFTLSAPWLPPHLTEPLYMWQTYNTRQPYAAPHLQDERSKANVTWVVSNFGPVPCVASSQFD